MLYSPAVPFLALQRSLMQFLILFLFPLIVKHEAQVSEAEQRVGILLSQESLSGAGALVDAILWPLLGMILPF